MQNQKTKKHTVQVLQKITGSHYTPKILADFVANRIVESGIDLSNTAKLNILDPAVGDGELILSLLNGLSKKNRNINVFGYDTNTFAVNESNTRIQTSFPDVLTNLENKSFLDFAFEYIEVKSTSNLLPLRKFDLVIANPPYVRTQILGADQSKHLANKFSLSGRIDLYHVFLLGIASVMRVGGVAGIIVSNRFMTTKSGAEIRKFIKREFEILHVWDLGDTQLFEAAVLPAVLLLRKKANKEQLSTPKFTSIYSTNQNCSKEINNNILDVIDHEGIINVKGNKSYIIQHGNLDLNKHNEDIWRISSKESEKWLTKVKSNSYCTFGEIGKIRVGVKTTADKVFIRSDWDEISINEQPEILKPLITHHIARRYKSKKIEKKILYTHTVEEGKRKAIKLEKFPFACKYLNKYKSVLESRSYVRNSGRNWYEIWVPQDPNSWQKPKVVFRDISKTPTFWLDKNGSVVNGDCYWLTNDFNENEDILWLCLAVGNSSFIEKFYDLSFNNKLYAGRRRFMTQYVEKFPLPDPTLKISEKIIRKTKSIFKNISSNKNCKNLEKKIDKLVWQSFGF